MQEKNLESKFWEPEHTYCTPCQKRERKEGGEKGKEGGNEGRRRRGKTSQF